MNHDLTRQGDEFAERITQFLAARQLAFTMERFKSRSCFRYTLPNAAGPLQLEIQARPYSDYFSVFATAPLRVPPERRARFRSLLLGQRFSRSPIRQEMDMMTGEVRVGYTALLCLDWVSEKRLAQMTTRSVALLEIFMRLLQTMPEEPDVRPEEEGYDCLRTIDPNP